MLDNYECLQPVAYSIIKNTVLENKISHAYLIETMGNAYGFDFALSFAKVLLCPNKFFNNMKCQNCNQCSVIDDNNFIELEVVDTEEMWIKKEKIELLQQNFSFKPIVGKRKVYIINNADKIRENVANKLLKFIEEPAEGIVAILVTENKEKIIDTIISRCQVISLKNTCDVDSDEVLSKYNSEKILVAIELIEYIEKNGYLTIIYSNELLHNKISDRLEYIEIFEIIILYYNDVINYKMNSSFIYFKDYNLNFKIISRLKIEKILKKIDLLIELKKLILNNVNLNLLIDRLIIDFEKVK